MAPPCLHPPGWCGWASAASSASPDPSTCVLWHCRPWALVVAQWLQLLRAENSPCATRLPCLGSVLEKPGPVRSPALGHLSRAFFFHTPWLVWVAGSSQLLCGLRAGTHPPSPPPPPGSAPHPLQPSPPHGAGDPVSQGQMGATQALPAPSCSQAHTHCFHMGRAGLPHPCLCLRSEHILHPQTRAQGV